MDQLNPDSRISVPDHIMYREVQGEGVLLNLQNGVYYGLNEIGARVWDIISSGNRLGTAHARLLNEYDVDSDRLWDDILVLVADLEKQGLVSLKRYGDEI